MLQHDVLAVFFPVPMPEKSSGLFRFLEGDLLHFQMPENSSVPRNATFYITPCQKILVPEVSFHGPDFYDMENVKCLILVTGSLFLHLGMQTVSFQGPEELSDMRGMRKIYMGGGKNVLWYQQRDC